MPATVARFRSNGKVLLSGEYLVMFGTRALALPARFGQTLEVSAESGEKAIHWEAFENGRGWFSASFSYSPWQILETGNFPVAVHLMGILEAAAALNPAAFSHQVGYHVKTGLEFDRSWGLGSSSTLLSNIAWWLDIDPYVLLHNVTPGSGYDIAAARSNQSIIYTWHEGKAIVREARFHPPFRDRLVFIYLGNKQDTRESIGRMLRRRKPGLELIQAVSSCTDRMARAANITEFEEVAREHESLVASFLGEKTIGEERFPDFPGMVKSLGAWGGDFILASHGDDQDLVIDYFTGKNLRPVFRYDELILHDLK